MLIPYLLFAEWYWGSCNANFKNDSNLYATQLPTEIPTEGWLNLPPSHWNTLIFSKTSNLWRQFSLQGCVYMFWEIIPQQDFCSEIIYFLLGIVFASFNSLFLIPLFSFHLVGQIFSRDMINAVSFFYLLKLSDFPLLFFSR